MKKILSLIFVMFFAVVLVGCGGGKKQTLSSINITGSGTISVGAKVKYTAKFTPADYKDQGVKWTSSDETKLTINESTGEATGVSAGNAYIFATSTAVTNIKGQKKVVVKDGSAGGDGEYPDLGGYTISIAQAKENLGDFDPFHSNYNQPDVEAKQKAWREVEADFNCTIKVEAYPDFAPWGPKRWDYILEQARNNTSDYDFLTVPDSQIPNLVNGGALLSMQNWYSYYGNDMMDKSLITSGTYKGNLYSFTTSKNNINNVMYYNIPLLEKLQERNPDLKEPAQLFLDGEWTFEKFEQFCYDAQAAMAEIYAEEGTAGDPSQKYFAVSGWDTYWFVGLATNDGEPLGDISDMSINFTTEHKQAAAELIKRLYASKVADPKQNVDQSVVTWMEGTSLFNTGSLWFVNASNRWKEGLWGDDTRYGYVPWPKADADVEYKVALGGQATWVMPIGNESEYPDYSDECSAENIYYAICEVFRRTKLYHESSDGYDAEIEEAAIAQKYAHSAASAKAYLEIQRLINEGKQYYDPLISSDNSVGSLYTGGADPTAIKGAVNGFINNKYNTWVEATAQLIPVLEESLRKVFS